MDKTLSGEIRETAEAVVFAAAEDLEEERKEPLDSCSIEEDKKQLLPKGWSET